MQYKEHSARADFFDAMSGPWSDREFLAERERDIENIMQKYSIKPEGLVVDVGCGTGAMYSYLARNVESVVAVDSSIQMLRALKRSMNIAPCLAIHAYAEYLPLANEVADWLVLFSTFPHISEKRESLLEAHRVLRARGKLLIFHAASRERINEIHSTLPEPLCHDLLPPMDELVAMGEQSGFSPDIHQESDNYYIYLASRK